MAHSPAASTVPAPRERPGSRLLSYAALGLLLVVALVGVDLLLLGRAGNVVLKPHYYMALGNSLSFGYQPDLNFSDGFADVVFRDIRSANVTDLIDYACGGETSTTMIEGNCFGKLIRQDAYAGPQLDAALGFLARHRGEVSPLTLEIGGNDILNDVDPGTCSVRSSLDDDFARLDANLRQTILPKLTTALEVPSGHQSGNFVLLNYYNPFARTCPNSVPVIHRLNDLISAAGAAFRLPVVDIYGAFGGDEAMADRVCALTWICDPRYRDFHATSEGYRVMAAAVEAVLGYPPTNPATSPRLAPPSDATPVATPAALRDRRLRFA